MKFGFICSAGGAPVFSALDILSELNYISKNDIKILVDRDCEAFETAKIRNIDTKKIYWTNKEEFSNKAYEYFLDCEAVLLLYSRLIGEELYSKIPTVNIHPSLLPAFQGSRPLTRAFESKIHFLGTSLHLVDETIDGGNMIGQIIKPIPFNSSFEYIKKISYLEKTYLVLLYIELIKEKMINFNLKEKQVTFLSKVNFNEYSNPALKDENILNLYNDFYRTEQNRTEQNRTEQNRTALIYNLYINLLFNKSQAVA
ncbi:formyltransferase family protein [Brachyspira pilosicoli]|uniref:phosphoribosylglycinamide formyltransferase 1 n=1 Tax=Brachyspira pilosicoli TaxID=52584 RepID=A0A5C8EE39_BRAPL|nr:formyltransferase family protein [Brachyspira pilosicoli]TXJ35234.1 hypothetical protein EPJ72_12565 [Brachyspira pilosicoli]